VVNRSGSLLLAGVIGGTGSLSQVGPGTLILTGTSIYTGPTTVSSGALQVDGVLGNTAVSVQSGASLTGVTTTDFSSFAFTANQRAAANLLDAVQLNPKAANLISFLDKEPFANLPRDFNKISPDGLTAFYEIGFSNANIQRLNLEGRFDDLRNGSNGFSSNMKVNGASIDLEDRADADGKSSKAVMEPILQHGPENRWGVWMTGFGDFASVDADANAKGYDFTTGGVSLGIDYRLTGQLAIGVMGEYSHTWTHLNPGGHIDVDSGRGGVYATWFNHGIYLNGAIYGGHNNYDSGRAGLEGLANSGGEEAEWSAFISGGFDFHLVL
jgi:outer membrane autotransporter protein